MVTVNKRKLILHVCTFFGRQIQTIVICANNRKTHFYNFNKTKFWWVFIFFNFKFDDIEEGNINIPRPTGTVRGISNTGFTDDDSIPPPDYEINNGLTDIDIMLQDEYDELDDADYPPSK